MVTKRTPQTVESNMMLMLVLELLLSKRPTSSCKQTLLFVSVTIFTPELEYVHVGVSGSHDGRLETKVTKVRI